MNIYQKLQAVMKEVSYVKKDAEVKGGGTYKAVTHDMVTAMVRPHFVTNGIIVIPRLVSGEVVDTGRKTSAGNPIIRYQGLYEVSFVNADEPTDVCAMLISAHAEDQGDKAPGKALSYAVKGAILKALLLESGENDEGRVQPEKSYTEAEQVGLDKLRAAALEGSATLETAWKAAGKLIRLALATELASLKEAAALADKEERHAA